MSQVKKLTHFFIYQPEITIDLAHLFMVILTKNTRGEVVIMCMDKHPHISGIYRGRAGTGGKGRAIAVRVFCRGPGYGWRWRTGMEVRGP